LFFGLFQNVKGDPESELGGLLAGSGLNLTQIAQLIAEFESLSRNITAEINDATAELSFISNSITGDDIRVKLRAGFGLHNSSGLPLLSNFITYDLNSTQAGQDAADFLTQFTQIIEYIESGETSGFQSFQDTIVSYYDAAALDATSLWGNWTNNTGENDPYQNYSIETIDEILTIYAYLTQNATTINGVNLTANQVKLDILIQNYIYQGTGTYLAIGALLGTYTGGFEKNFDKFVAEFPILNGSGLYTFTDGVNESVINEDFLTILTPLSMIGNLSWLNKVTINETDTAEVITTTYLEGIRSRRMFYTFNTTQQNISILWDPTTGFQGSNTGLASISVLSFLVAILSTIILCLQV